MITTILTCFAVLVIFVWMCGILACLLKLEEIAKDIATIKEKLSGKTVSNLEDTYQK